MKEWDKITERRQTNTLMEEKIKGVEVALSDLNESVKEVKGVLFGEKGEKGVVAKLKDMIDIAKSIEGTLAWIAKIIFASLLVAALPSIANFINTITHLKRG